MIMCGRYYIEISDEELREIAGEVEKKSREYPGQMTLKTSGEIFPTDIVPVQTGAKQFLPMKWGFIGLDGNPVINARSETALQKPMFQRAMRENRCLIPASGYYEWQRDGNKRIKYRFYIPNEPMYLAGCYRQELDDPFRNFVILTRRAANGLEAIHDRMPVIIPPKYTETWLHESPGVIEYAVRDLAFEAV